MECFDLAVIGLGTAGAAAAARAAEAGLRVVGLDARALDQAGARWVNGVPGWSFEAAGLARPERPELRAEGMTFHIVAGWGPARLTVHNHDILQVDMRRLVARLQALASAAGADLRGGVRVRGYADGVLDTDDGPIQARFVADASGLGGAGLIERPKVRAEQLCVAAQEVRTVRDRQAAEAFFQENGASEGEVLCFTSVAGGYSIVNVRLDGDEIDILTGSIPALGVPSGRALADRFVERHPWIGPPVFGGARALPLRPPYTRLAEGPVALLGDAGCQVYAMHGSGIAAGMIAGRMLADTLAEGGMPEDYNFRWQRSWGGLMAGSAVFSRFSAQLSVDDVVALMSSGLMTEGLARKGLDQRPPRPSPADLPRVALGLARAPAFATRLAPVIARMAALDALYRTCPRDPARLGAFEARVARLLGS